MVLNNIKSRKLNGGFTIVELLVVIVVIGILAAITIVSYTGITAKANQSKAIANVNSIGSVVDMIASETGYYPSTIAGVTAGGAYAKVPAGISVSTAAPVLATATTLFQYYYCGTAGSANGAKINYYDQVASGVVSIYFGAGSGACTIAT